MAGSKPTFVANHLKEMLHRGNPKLFGNRSVCEAQRVAGGPCPGALVVAPDAAGPGALMGSQIGRAGVYARFGLLIEFRVCALNNPIGTFGSYHRPEPQNEPQRAAILSQSLLTELPVVPGPAGMITGHTAHTCGTC